MHRFVARRATCMGVLALCVLALPLVAYASTSNVARSITLDPKGNSTTPMALDGTVSAQGNVHVCVAHVAVAGQRYASATGKWVVVGTGYTDKTGFYDFPVPSAKGKYRTIAKPTSKTNKAGNTFNCMKAVSPVEKVTS